MEAVLEDPYILIHEKKIFVDEGPAAAAGAGGAGRQALLIIAEEVEGEGAGHAGGQQAARHAERRVGEGALMTVYQDNCRMAKGRSKGI